MHPSCTGHWTNLDEEDTLPRTEQLTLASIEVFAYKELWEDYGIVADVPVCSNISQIPLSYVVFIPLSNSPSLKVSLVQRSTNSYHQISSTGDVQGSPRPMGD